MFSRVVSLSLSKFILLQRGSIPLSSTPTITPYFHYLGPLVLCRSLNKIVARKEATLISGPFAPSLTLIQGLKPKLKLIAYKLGIYCVLDICVCDRRQP